MVFYYKGDYDKAIEYYKKALKIRLKVLGEEHPSTAATYNNLGMAYHSKGDYDKAIEFFEKALNIYEQKFGECHKYTKIVLENLYESLKSKADQMLQKLESLKSKCGK